MREREWLESDIDHLKRESELRETIIVRFEIENSGLREDKENFMRSLTAPTKRNACSSKATVIARR